MDQMIVQSPSLLTYELWASLNWLPPLQSVSVTLWADATCHWEKKFKDKVSETTENSLLASLKVRQQIPEGNWPDGEGVGEPPSESPQVRDWCRKIPLGRTEPRAMGRSDLQGWGAECKREGCRRGLRSGEAGPRKACKHSSQLRHLNSHRKSPVSGRRRRAWKPSPRLPFEEEPGGCSALVLLRVVFSRKTGSLLFRKPQTTGFTLPLFILSSNWRSYGKSLLFFLK